ncbi:hypothetical protein D3C80_1738110 [compost metagenome]
MQGQLGQFAIGLGQRLGKVGGPGFQARIEDRGQQGDAQYRQGGDQDQVVEAIAAQAIDGCAAKTARRKLRGGHAGVVHADDGNAHDHRRATTDQAHMRRVLAQAEGNPECSARGTNRYAQ